MEQERKFGEHGKKQLEGENCRKRPRTEEENADEVPTRKNPSDPQNPLDELAPFSTPTSTEPCQIFINHRGSDVKYTLATQIYEKLESMGYRAFLDVESLEPGDVIPAEIVAAMKSASLHVAIVSLNYIHSPWCLAELAFILKTGARVIPIFYHVQPSDLRYAHKGKGKYVDAFSEYEKKGRYTQEKINQWKEALRQISFLYGFEVNNNEDEAKVLKNVVDIALKVMKHDPIWVAEHPVGLDKLVEAFNSITSEGEVKIRGIVGMGGSGKTTLAKELFNMNFSSFSSCSFVADVRDAASRNALPDKQKKLLKDLGVAHLPFDSVDEGKAVLANRLSSVRALIVLDDVDHIDQLCALLPNKNNLGSQSMVIVTSRELGVLRSWGLSSCIYKMPELEKVLARQLFCWHAFKQPSPLAEFEDLVENFLKACNGLPLSLKVMGAHLYGSRSKVYWTSELKKIIKIVPGDIQSRLRLSYDALDEEEKEMFLDVACFLIGETENTATAVWEAMDLNAVTGLQTLMDKCLVELVEGGDLWDDVFYWNWGRTDHRQIKMHDHLRDMGREIARQQSSYRLWWPGQIHNMKNHFKKEIPIRGILPAATFQAFKEYKPQLRGISNGLQILHVEGIEFTEEFASFSEDLVWLKWKRFGLRNLPSWLTVRHLSVLELSGAGRLEELWEDNVDPPLQLRKLIIRYDNILGGLLRLPTSIGWLQYLNMISIQFVGSSLPEEFCRLLALEYLQLHCRRLGSLPDDFGNLINLKHIDLTNCCELRTLPDSFKHLIHLEHLHLFYCRKLKLKLDVFENTRKLKSLGFRGCKELEDLPSEIVNQTSLTELDLRGCIKLRGLPSNIGQLVDLERLRIESHILTSLQTSVGTFSSLKHFEISVDAKAEDCKAVSRLSISNDFCPNLQLFVALSCSFIEIERLPVCLKKLVICGCEGLKKMRCLTGLASLEELVIRNCPLLEEMPSFSDLGSLKSFEMEDCPKVEKIDGLQHSESNYLCYSQENPLDILILRPP